MKNLAGATAILCAALLAGVTAQPSQRYDLTRAGNFPHSNTVLVQ